MRSLMIGLVVAGLMSVSSMAAAQDMDRAHRLALAERAIDAMQADQMAEQMAAISAAFEPDDLSGLSARERIAIIEVRDEVTRNIMERMIDGMSDIFADLYNTEELEAMVAFYESPIGRSITAKSMQATPHIIELTRSLLPDMMRQMANGICDRLECTPQERRDLLREMMVGAGMSES